MAIFRCNSCGHLREVTNDYVGVSVKCPSCKKANPVHDTVTFVEKLVGKYLVQRMELRTLKQSSEPAELTAAPLLESNSLADIDLFNTTALTSKQQYQPILAWFEKLRIEVEVNHQSVDTRGFFDEIAMELGDNYETLKFVSNQIKFTQGKEFGNAKIDLSNKSKKEIKEITEFCKLLYEYSFVARFDHNKKENIIWLTLQKAKTIIRFFNGIWLEWYVLMKLLSFFRDKKLPAACLRGLSIKHSNEDANELDVFFLVGDIPICIECKSGEYRKDIQKYSNLRKKFKLEKSNFLLCVADLAEDQIQGLNSMYDLTFVNPQTLLEHVEQLIAQ
jgi:phage FluMu protein Com